MLSPTSLILVAVMTDPKDLEIARILGWYRIPLKKAPKVISVDYLALYQTGSFGARGWCIEYVAPVVGHELVSRGELFQDQKNHPRAHEEYFKIQIGPVERLSKPIQAGKWKRITFLYTTGEYLLSARSVNDLVIHSDERKLLWKSLRERVVQSPGYSTEPLPQLDLEPDVLAVLLGIYRERP